MDRISLPGYGMGEGWGHRWRFICGCEWIGNDTGFRADLCGGSVSLTDGSDFRWTHMEVRRFRWVRGAWEATVGGLGESLKWGGGTDGRDAPEALSLSRLHLIGGREFS